MAAYGHLTLLLCFTSNVWVQGTTPTISHITQMQIRDIGSQVRLDCTVHNGLDYPVLWVKFDHPESHEGIPLAINSGLIIRESRFSFKHDKATETYSLSIKNLNEKDSGWYQCQVLISVSKRVTAGVELQVRQPRIITNNSTKTA